MSLKVVLLLMIIIVTGIVGGNRFINIRSTSEFVDKTLLIKEILNHKILFINAPRGFCKSTNLDMIGLFLSNHHKKSEIAPYFKGTNIFNDEEFVKNHLGEHPVIRCNLFVDGGITDFDSILTLLKASLHNAYLDHTYLLQSKKIAEEAKTCMKPYTDLSTIQQMDSDRVIEGLSLLSTFLHDHHSKHVILLMDEFGRGVTEKILQRNTDVSLLLNLYTSILRTTFGNDSVISHTVLLGETWLYGLKGDPLPLIDGVGFLQRSEFSPFFGFTQNEASDLMKKFKVQEDKRQEVYKWFGGYSSCDTKVQVFNPTSLLQYLKHGCIGKCWVGSQLATDLIEFMFQELGFKNNFSNLVMNSSSNVVINIERDMRLVCLENLKNKISQIPEHCGNLFYRILLETGYLTFSESQGNDKKIVSLSIPNEEIRSFFKPYISKFGIVEWQNTSSLNLSNILSTN